MRMILGLLCAAILLSGTGLGAPVRAFEFFDPSLPFSATRVIQIEDEIIEGRVHHNPGITREELTIKGKTYRLILNIRGNSATVLIDDARLAIEAPFALARGMFSSVPDDLTGLQPTGETLLQGYQVTQYDYTADGGQGSMWMTPEGIIMRLVGAGQNGMRFAMELRDLKIGKQSPGLFTVPDGYQKIYINTASITGFNLQQMINELPGR